MVNDDDFDPFLSEEEIEAEAERIKARRLEVATLFYKGYIEGAEAKDAIEAIRSLLEGQYEMSLDGIARRMRLIEKQEVEVTAGELVRAIREETGEEEPTLAEMIARGIERGIMEGEEPLFIDLSSDNPADFII